MTKFAAGIIKEAKNLGLNIPKDIAVIGFDDQPIAELIEPALTTIKQPTKEMGQKTMEVMLSMLINQASSTEQQVIELPIHVISRESV
ncbi:substrate-binding domain-containing protein [Alkalihalobacillus deserti]|uniref:substrate-binding domain-containing protein n=1 Tax=Alkalihalobacillus deserti TaxID=2879466 RepID=UPI0027E14EB1|nr:substrate-binding domain-containing protein [Alkalihalobacillus deserti]